MDANNMEMLYDRGFFAILVVEYNAGFLHVGRRDLSLSDFKSCQHVAQEDEGQAVNAVAWDYFLRTVRNVDGLKRYQGLKAAMRMVTTQVSHPLAPGITNFKDKETQRI